VVLSLVLLVLLLDLAFGVGVKSPGSSFLTQSQLVAMTASILMGTLDSDDEHPVRVINSVPRDKARDRVRRSVQSIFKEHGPYYVRRAYRMTEEAFWELHALLKPLMGSTRMKLGGKVKRHRNGGKNGLICSETRLAVAIRYFAGGRPEDIAISHGISHSEVFYSVWKVVDAINKCPELVFGYPESHEKQRELAVAFQCHSSAGIASCAGAIDGLLIWIERPSKLNCVIAGCGPKKFYCGRKHKFGLNLQGTCDAEGKFLEISIGHPASTSDFLAFTTSGFHKKLETPGFLAPGLAIFGDAAYVNNGYFVSPFKNAKSGIRDSFNFYQSQLRIKIECAFGMFVGRWGLLRRALPQAMTLKKINGLTYCLCRLHNFCIDHNGIGKPLLAPLQSDAMESLVHNGVSPEELLSGGEHHDDTSKQYRQNFVRNSLLLSTIAPRDIIVSLLERNDFKRPTPKTWLTESVEAL
jgi:hypothetical protein